MADIIEYSDNVARFIKGHSFDSFVADKNMKVNLRFRADKGIKAALAEAKFRTAEDMLSKKKQPTKSQAPEVSKSCS